MSCAPQLAPSRRAALSAAPAPAPRASRSKSQTFLGDVAKVSKDPMADKLPVLRVPVPAAHAAPFPALPFANIEDGGETLAALFAKASATFIVMGTSVYATQVRTRARDGLV